jgi:hypothetical protein
MRKHEGQQQVLVYHDGKLCWRIRQVHYNPIRKPWYKFWKLEDIDITYGEPKYIEIKEDNE